MKMIYSISKILMYCMTFSRKENIKYVQHESVGVKYEQHESVGVLWV